MKLLRALAIGLAAAAPAWGQAEVPGSAPASVVDCRLCHTSDAPTKEKPALVRCPRNRTKGVHSPAQAPESISLGASGGTYGPVTFSHRAHAEMAEMGGGCYRCHHYDQGGPIQKCGACHSAKRARDDLGKPDLEGAVHRLCIECHREWSHETDCGVCHGGKAAPKAALPQVTVYRTESGPGKFVTFPHGDHARRFGLKCAQCHSGLSCAGCHDPLREARAAPAGRAKGEDPHASCSACHSRDKCSACHSSRPTGAFDHGRSTGWPQNRFHRALECVRCHTTPGRFTKLDGGCDSCHKGWQAKFDHKKTGLALDETHAALECDACHADKNFVAPPACGSCHDKSYPKDKPGRLVVGKSRR